MTTKEVRAVMTGKVRTVTIEKFRAVMTGKVRMVMTKKFRAVMTKEVSNEESGDITIGSRR